MSKNIDQVYTANPISVNAPTDLMYFGQSPYGIGDDAAMTFANFAAQFTSSKLNSAQIFVGNSFNIAQAVAMTGDISISNVGLTSIVNNAVTYAKFQQVPAESLIGNSTNAIGNVSSISASSDGQILRSNSGTLGFGSIDLSNSNTVGTSILGVANGGTNATSQTMNGINYFNGTSIISSAALTNGQILIGSTGSAPIPGTITPGTGITIANSTGIIIISATGNGPYTELTSSAGIVTNHTYTANSSSLITMTLPSTSSPGDYLKINYKGTGGWKIGQQAGQQIQYGTALTTLGTGGSLSSSTAGNCVTLICTTSNSFWIVQSSQGNLTVV